MAPPTDVSSVGWFFGGAATLGDKEWTPYRGSDPEKIAQKSHEYRERFGKFMDSVTPDFLTAPFRWAGGKAGELFHKAFGGQSPEVVAAALKKGDKRVKEMQEKLERYQQEFDDLRRKAHEAKARLDACCRDHPPEAAQPQESQ